VLPAAATSGRQRGTRRRQLEGGVLIWLRPRATWAWCSSRSTVAVARVLGMIVSEQDGCRLLVTATLRRS
jgi:hypothetical protein